MAESESNSALSKEDIRSLRFVFLGTNIVFWILAVFIINVMFSLTRELREQHKTLKVLMQITSKQSLDQFRAVNADDEVLYQFKRTPMEYMPGYEDMPEGMAGEGSYNQAPGSPDPDHRGHNHAQDTEAAPPPE